MIVDDANKSEKSPDTACIMFTMSGGTMDTFPLINSNNQRTGPMASAVMRLMSNHPEELESLYLKEAHAPDHRNG